MDISTLERDGWNRLSFYSLLYDFGDSKTAPSMRTPTEKFRHTARTALIDLLNNGYLTRHESDTCLSSVIFQLQPGTMNAAAIALAFTTYYEPLNRYLVKPVADASGNEFRIQKKKCWESLAQKLNDKSDPFLNRFAQEHGITSADLLRYFFLLTRRKDLLR